MSQEAKASGSKGKWGFRKKARDLKEGLFSSRPKIEAKTPTGSASLPPDNHVLSSEQHIESNRGPSPIACGSNGVHPPVQEHDRKASDISIRPISEVLRLPSENHARASIAEAETGIQQSDEPHLRRLAPEDRSREEEDPHASTVDDDDEHHTQQKQTKEPVFKPIRQLWGEAYEELRIEDGGLVAEYEAKLRESLTGAIALSSIGSTVRCENLMKSVVDQKLAKYKEDAWKVKALGESFLVKDLTKPLVGIVKWADKYIGDALKSNPMASFGWAGVMVFVPLLLNPSEQEKALLEGLASISKMHVRSTMQENLYFRRWEVNSDKNDRKAFLPAHQSYRATLKALYIHILRFQATSVCYFTKNGGLRMLADTVKWENWNDLLKEAANQDKEMCRAYNLLSDVRIDEEFEKLNQRHVETIDVLRSGFSDIAALREAVKSAQRNQNRSELLVWLSSVDPSQNFNNARDKYVNGGAGTGDWLTSENEDFGGWLTAPNSLIWLNGKAGSGKSVLSSSVISFLKDASKEEPRIAIAYFYFNFNDQEKQNAISMMESIIRQICCCRPDTPPSIKALEDLKARGQRPNLETLQKAFLENLQGFSRVYIIIDALDECPELEDKRRQLLTCLNLIHQKALDNLHMFWTSRREKDIEISYESIETRSEPCDIDLSKYKPAIDHDIGLLIDSTLASDAYKSWSAELKAEARMILIERSDCMFQYVACQFSELQKHSQPREIRMTLQELPQGLDATYDRMLARIGPADQKQVARVLGWLCFSLRPLLLEEIAEIFILDPDAKVPFDDDNRFLTPSLALKLLSGLVTEIPRKLERWDRDHYARHGDVAVEIRLAHYSVKEYLVSSRLSPTHCTFGIAERTANIHIAESCIAYHLHLSETVEATQRLVRRFQLWEYVVAYLPKHLDLITNEAFTHLLTKQALKAFARGSQSLLNMARIRHPDKHEPRWDMTAEKLMTPLYYASSIDALQVSELTIKADEGSSIDEFSVEVSHGTALSAAAVNGNINIVQILLDKGADVNTQGGKYGNALQAAASKDNVFEAAAYNGNIDIVQLLLDKGADIDAQGGWHGDALQAATFEGDIDIVQLLLDKGANVNAQGGAFGYALQAAASSGHIDIVQLLLDKGADVNTQGGDFGNALGAAAASRNIDIVQLLLDKGADVDAQGGWHGNALQAATFEGGIDIVQLLLDKGTDVNTQGGRLGNALQAAALSRNIDIVQLLLDKGADVNAQGGRLGNALQAAAYNGTIDIVQLILDKGADIDTQGGIFGNALQAGVALKRWDIVEVLLSKGAQVDQAGPQWDNLLASVENYDSRGSADCLRMFQLDPTPGGLEKMKALQRERMNEEGECRQVMH